MREQSQSGYMYARTESEENKWPRRDTRVRWKAKKKKSPQCCLIASRKNYKSFVNFLFFFFFRHKTKDWFIAFVLRHVLMNRCAEKKKNPIYHIQITIIIFLVSRTKPFDFKRIITWHVFKCVQGKTFIKARMFLYTKKKKRLKLKTLSEYILLHLLQVSNRRYLNSLALRGRCARSTFLGSLIVGDFKGIKNVKRFRGIHFNYESFPYYRDYSAIYW